MSKCVLVVEDEPLIRLLVIDILSEAGFEVLQAEGPAEALTLLKSDETDRRIAHGRPYAWVHGRI